MHNADDDSIGRKKGGAVRYEPNWVKGKENMRRINNLERTEGRKDRLITIGHPESRALIML